MRLFKQWFKKPVNEEEYPELVGEETKPTKKKKRAHNCWDCGSKDFMMGPRGGMAQNVMCANCGSKFNFVFGKLHERI